MMQAIPDVGTGTMAIAMAPAREPSDVDYHGFADVEIVLRIPIELHASLQAKATRKGIDIPTLLRRMLWWSIPMQWHCLMQQILRGGLDD